MVENIDNRNLTMIYKNFKIGLKLFSTNMQYIEEAKSLYGRGLFNYIELYSVPNSYKDCIDYWKLLDIPFVIHAPHFGGGLNLGDWSKKDSNEKLIKESFLYADSLKSGDVIVHPGVRGELTETIIQIKKIYDNRIIIENKPFCSVNKKFTCIGATIYDIKNIIDQTKVRFCLDMGHAICSANSLNIEPKKYIKQFMTLNPYMFHLSDGDYNGVSDSHKHFGKGSFPIKELIDFFPYNSIVTIETEKSFSDSLSDFVIDLNYIAP